MLFAGTLVILITSLFMNAGGTMQISSDSKTPNQVVMNTVISAASSGLLIAVTTQYLNCVETKQRIQDSQMLYHYNVHQLCNGVLAGMVSVTASCNNIELWAAAAVGIIGSLIYIQTQKLISRYEIDDPLDISEVHGFCGIWAIIAVGIFDQEKGFFYTGNANQLGIQLVGALAYSIWAALLSFFFFFALKKNGRLRINLVYEIIGLDFMKHRTNGSINLLNFEEEQRRDFIRKLNIKKLRKKVID